jgi:exopolysaccharide biosynthesis polyprenyl glycosylphosphotransferase
VIVHNDYRTEQRPSAAPHHAVGSAPSTPAGAGPLTADPRTLEILARRRGTPNPRHRGWLVRRALIIADVTGLLAAFLAAQLVMYVVIGESVPGHTGLATLVVVASIPAWILVAKLYGLYDQDGERAYHATSDDIIGVLHVTTIGTWSLYALVQLTGVANPTIARTVTVWLLAALFIIALRVVARRLCRHSLMYLQNTLIIGAGDVGQRVARKLLAHPEYGLNLVGFVDNDPKPRRTGLEGLRLLGTPTELPQIVRALDVERVIVAFSNDTPQQTIEVIRSLSDQYVQIDIVPRLFELLPATVRIDTVEGLPIVALPPVNTAPSAMLIKRTIDLVVSAAALVLLAPLMALIAWRVRRDSPGPILFRQTRLGLHGEPFTALKFRTMYVNTSPDEHRAYIAQTMDPGTAEDRNGIFKLDQADAVTPRGRWLRKTSLDELPQLWNVLRGDMSLVGPRPCIPYETENFLPHHFDRFLVPAGITGLWQVTARAHSTFREALDMDVAYAHSWSLGLDLRLMCRTPATLLVRKGTT